MAPPRSPASRCCEQCSNSTACPTSDTYMNVYGPRMDYRGTYVSVIMKVLDKIFAGEAPVIFGDGSQVYDFIYIEDVAEANVLGMKADCADENFNIGMGVGTS